MKLLLKKGPPYREIQSTSLPAGSCVMCLSVSGFVKVVKAVFSDVEFKNFRFGGQVIKVESNDDRLWFPRAHAEGFPVVLISCIFQLFNFISLEGQYKLHLCRHLTSVYIELWQYCLLLNVKKIDECHKGRYHWEYCWDSLPRCHQQCLLLDNHSQQCPNLNP